MHSNMFRPILILLSITFVCFLIGCSHYILIKKTSLGVTSPATDPQTTSTPSFKKMRSDVKTIAYRPPDSCLNLGAAQVSGQGDPNQRVMQTVCGVWLSELEKTFVSKGFNVISWQALTANMGGYIQGDVAIDRAMEMGGNIVFIINSLTIDEIDPSKSTTSKTEFFVSNEKMEPLRPYAASEKKKNMLLAVVPQDAAIPPKQLAATLDVTAVDVHSKQSIWFYRQTVSDKYQDEYSWEGIFRCNRKICVNAFSATTQGRAVPNKTSIIITQNEHPAQDADVLQRQRHHLIQSAVTSLADNFVAFEPAGANQPEQLVAPALNPNPVENQTSIAPVPTPTSANTTAPSDPGPCEYISCSGHGTCIAKAGNPVCSCEQGYVPDSAGFNCILFPKKR